MNVEIKKYGDIPINKKELSKYLGITIEDEKFVDYIDSAINEFNGKQKFSVCFIKAPIFIKENQVDFYFFKTESKSLKNCLVGCHEAVIFVATIGFEIDRLIRKYSSLSISKAICFNALGTERVESLCNAFCEEIKKDVCPKGITMRFSPGYGDLPLEMQKDIFDLLCCEKNIGVSLNESLLMSPSKSVSAIVGIKDNGNDIINEKESCDLCSKTDCEFRG